MGERKLKIADVARGTGLYRGTVTLLYEETAAKVDIETIDRLCTFLGITVGDLFEQVAPLPTLGVGAAPGSSEPDGPAKAGKQ